MCCKIFVKNVLFMFVWKAPGMIVVKYFENDKCDPPQRPYTSATGNEHI